MKIGSGANLFLIAVFVCSLVVYGKNSVAESVNENDWYTIKATGQLGERGERMVECALAEYTPTETVRTADKLGWTYTIATIPENSETASIVEFEVKSMGPGSTDKALMLFFRGERLCKYSVENWPFPGQKPTLVKRNAYK